MTQRDDRILWRPSRERVAGSVLAEFANRHGPYAGQTFFDYDGLHRWSIEQPKALWESVWKFGGVIGEPGEIVFESGADMRTARFFPGATLNFAENLLRRSDSGEAIVALGEDGRCRRVTWQELNDEVGAFSAWLEEVGLEAGDRVATVLPNIAETVSAMLATSALGGVFSSASPDFGEQGLLDRFAQVDPKILIACDGYQYNGKTLDIRERISAVVKQLPTVKQVVIVPYMDHDVPRRDAGLERSDRCATRLCSAVCPTAIRSPAVHHVHQRHDRKTEVHRPSGRWSPASASEGASLARRSAPRPEGFLLHDLWLDDVELAGVGAGLRGDPDAVRRFAFPSGRQPNVRLRPG